MYTTQSALEEVSRAQQADTFAICGGKLDVRSSWMNRMIAKIRLSCKVTQGWTILGFNR